ncbi:MAG: hypothetical protein WKG07_18120 [Hymenobacter sp.]
MFQLARVEGTLAYAADVLLPHRKDYYQLVFVRRGGSRHWVDMRPYVLQDNTFYSTVPGQLMVKEEPQPLWGTTLAFGREFLALQQHTALAKLPLLQNLHNAHELRLTAADAAFVEDLLDKLAAEYDRPRPVAAPDASRLPGSTAHSPEPALHAAVCRRGRGRPTAAEKLPGED